MCKQQVTICALATLALSIAFGSTPGQVQGATKKKGSAATPMIVVGGASWCRFCKELKERLATDPTVTPLSSQFRVSYVDLEDKAQAAEFTKKFHLQGVSLPTLVIAAPDGTPVEVRQGSPQGDALPRILQQAMMKLGIKPGDAIAQADKKGADKKRTGKDKDASEQDSLEKESSAKRTAAKTKDPEVEAQLTALREARKLLREKKTADAVALLAPYAGPPQPTGSLGSLLKSLEKEGHTMVAGAREQMENPKRLEIGAVALIKARRLYGKLPSLEGEISAGLAALAKAPQGDELLKQAEAVDQGRALDEAGDATAAIEVYQSVVTQYANTAVAAMATKRIALLRSAAKSQ